jgi:2-methylaconitate cis-trans-isomerase PrpF
MSAAVGPFAIDEGLVQAVEPVTRIHVLATNTGKSYMAYVPVREGQAEVEGDYLIDGVPGPGARIALEYLKPDGSLGGALLPTGMPRQQIKLADGREVTISIVDAALPMVYVRLRTWGLRPRVWRRNWTGDRAASRHSRRSAVTRQCCRSGTEYRDGTREG